MHAEHLGYQSGLGSDGGLAPAVRVFVADEHRSFIDALNAFLRVDPTIQVIGYAQQPTEVLERVAQLRPDVIIIESDGVALRGAALLAELWDIALGVAVILTATDFLSAEAANAQRVGALGYIDKATAADELFDLIWSLYSRGLSSGLHEFQPASYVHRDGNDPTDDLLRLGRYEAASLRLLRQGRQPEEIAATLGLPEPSLDTCLRRVMVKLGLQDLAALCEYAAANGD